MSATEDDLEADDGLGAELADALRAVGRGVGVGIGFLFRGVGWLAFFSVPALLMWLMINAVQWGFADPIIGSPPGTPEGTGLGLVVAAMALYAVHSVIKP